jgi:hypothetical protein
VDVLEKLSRFFGRHLGPPWLALSVAAWMLALVGWGTLARRALPVEHRIKWEAPLEQRAPLYAKFDSGWYLRIMETGYGPAPPPGMPSEHAFFPLYPMAAKVLCATFGMDGFCAGLIVTYTCLFLAMPLFLREAAARLDQTQARHAVVFLLLSPVAFFLQAVYAESMFLLLAILAFRDTRSGRAGRALLWGALLGLTRASAVAAGPALFLAALEARDAGGRRRWGRALAIGAVPVVTALAWIFGMGEAHGEPGLFLRAMEGWHRGKSSWAGVYEWLWQMKLSIKFGLWMKDPTRALDYGMVVLVAAVAVWQAVRRRWSDAAWMGCAIALPITTGLTGGIPRFLLVVYPTYIAMAEGSCGSPRARWAAWIASGAVLLWTSGRFVNWLWVA